MRVFDFIPDRKVPIDMLFQLPPSGSLVYVAQAHLGLTKLAARVSSPVAVAEALNVSFSDEYIYGALKCQ